MFAIESMGVESLFALLLNVSLKATLLAVTVWLILKLFRVRSVTVRHRVWTLVLGCMLLLPGIVSIAPEVGVPITWLSAPSPIDAEASRLSAAAALQESLSQPAIPEISASDVSTILDVSPVRSASDIKDAAFSSLPVETADAAPKDSMDSAPGRQASPLFPLVVVYTIGVALLLSRLLIGFVHSRRLIQRARPIELLASDDVPQTSHRIMESEHVRVPLTLGLWRPVIVLPVHWHTWDASVMQMALAHEAEHVRRRDTWVSLAATLNAGLYWFHPVAWLLQWHIAELAEHACDDEVIRTTGQRIAYAQILVDMASRLSSGEARYQPIGICMAAKPMVEERVNRILDRERPLATRVGRLSSLLLAAIIAAATIVTAGLSAAPITYAAEPTLALPQVGPAFDEPRQKGQEAKTDTTVDKVVLPDGASTSLKPPENDNGTFLITGRDTQQSKAEDGRPAEQQSMLNHWLRRGKQVFDPTVLSETQARHFVLNGPLFTDDELKRLVDHTDQQTLTFFDTRIKGPGLRHLSKLHNLEMLVLLGPGITDEWLANLPDLPRLRHIIISQTDVTALGLLHLKRFPLLRHLDLRHSDLDDGALKVLRHLPNLVMLHVGNTHIGDDGLANLRFTPKLFRLYLTHTEVTDVGLEHLRHVPNLIDFSLASERVKGAGTANLKHTKHLKQLQFVGGNVSDAWLSSIPLLEELDWLELYGTGVTSSGLKPIGAWTKLEKLYLNSNSSIDDDVVTYLDGLKRLELIELQGTSVTSEGKETLQRILPLATAIIGSP